MPNLAIYDELAQSTDRDDESTHLVCCNPDIALCGADVTDTPEVEPWPDDDACLVCIEFKDSPCCPECDWRPGE